MKCRSRIETRSVEERQREVRARALELPAASAAAVEPRAEATLTEPRATENSAQRRGASRDVQSESDTRCSAKFQFICNAR